MRATLVDSLNARGLLVIIILHGYQAMKAFRCGTHLLTHSPPPTIGIIPLRGAQFLPLVSAENPSTAYQVKGSRSLFLPLNPFEGVDVHIDQEEEEEEEI